MPVYKVGVCSECARSSLAFLSTKYCGQGLAKVEECEFTIVNDHIEKDNNAEIGLIDRL